jgi:deferrochelatase/peroxidase EfeB
MMLVAFDVLASDKADLERLFRLLTSRFAFLTTGGPAPDTPNPRLLLWIQVSSAHTLRQTT